MADETSGRLIRTIFIAVAEIGAYNNACRIEKVISAQARISAARSRSPPVLVSELAVTAAIMPVPTPPETTVSR